MFLFEYIKNPRSVGAVLPSSKYLAAAMINAIDFENTNCIVEYGPGTGAFTEKILARVHPSTIVILIEQNPTFYKELQQLYGHKPNVILINDSAERIKDILFEHSITKIDYIVSGLPFASLPKAVSDEILTRTSEVVGNHGTFITFQYSLLKEKYLHSFFQEGTRKKLLCNFPPAYVLTYKGGNE